MHGTWLIYKHQRRKVLRQSSTELLTCSRKTREGYGKYFCKTAAFSSLRIFSIKVTHSHAQNSGSVTEHGSVWTSQDSKPNWKDALPPKSPPKHATDVWEQHTTRYTHTHTALLKNGWCSHNFMITDRNKHPRAPNLSGSPSFLSASSRFWNSVWKISRCFSMSTCSHFLASSSCVLSWRYTWTLRCSSSRRASACGSELRSMVWTCVFLNKNNDKFNSQSCPT